jgi:RNA polymerase primary sigma factor
MKLVVSNSSRMQIRRSILQALAEQSLYFCLPLNKIIQINKMYALLEQSNERPPSAEEIAKEPDMTVNEESMKILVVTFQWMHHL